MTTRRQSWFSNTRLIAIGLLIGLGLIYLPIIAHDFVWDDLTFVHALWPLHDLDRVEQPDEGRGRMSIRRRASTE